MVRTRLLLIIAGLVVATVTGAANAQPRTADVVAGNRLAQEYCGMCHAIGSGGSPLPNAPPFRDLFKRYPPGDLGRLLHEGMIAPSSPPEEGSPRRHPKMPVATLGDDQVAELRAYLTLLEHRGRTTRSVRP